MNFRNKTMEELEEIEQELLDKDEEEEKYGYYYNFVSLYEEMHQQLIRLSRGNREEYRVKRSYLERKLVRYLIIYGSYLKMTYRRDDQHAVYHLRQALGYDPENPIAHYRLGFLSFGMFRRA